MSSSGRDHRKLLERFLPWWLIARIGSVAELFQHIYREPRNPVEAEVHRELLDRGHAIIRSGWPDFLVISGPDEIYLVEVKGPGDALRANQVAVLELLARAGIDTYIRWPDYYEAIGDSTPWVDRV